MIRVALASVLALMVIPGGAAFADEGPSATTADDAFIVELEEYTQGDSSNSPRGPEQTVEYRWQPACPSDPTALAGYHVPCTELFDCDRDGVPWELRAHSGDTSWRVRIECRNTNSPTITPAAVATAFRRIPLPKLNSVSQPATKTLVNFDTIFFVDAETLDRSIRLLGQDVDLTITPSRFRWTFGDGTERVTTTPGHAYPAKTVTHRYERAHVTVEHQVEVTWTATWRVNGGPWQDVPGSVTITGPSTPLRVAEAVPLLSSGDD